MKIKSALWIALVWAIASAAGQAEAGQTEYGPVEARLNLGTIIVYRPWSIIGYPMTNWEFNLNHGPDLMVRNGTYYRLTVLPGENIISHDDMPFIDEDPQTVNVRPGQTVYFQYALIWGFIFEVADDQESAARTVSKLEPLD
jgi:hypothetical protein